MLVEGVSGSDELTRTGTGLSRIASNTATLLGVFCTNAIFGIAANYIVAHFLGVENFGRMGLILSLTSAMALARSGIATTVLRITAQRTYSDADLAISAVVLQMGIGATVFAAVVPVVLTVDRSVELLVPTLMIGAALLLQTLYDVPGALFAGKDRMRWQLAGSLAIVATVLLALLFFSVFGWRMLAWPAAFLLSTAVVAAGSWRMATRRIGRGKVSRDVVWPLFASGAALSGVGLLQQIHWTADMALVRWLSSPYELGIFTAGVRITPTFRTIASILTLAMLPKLCREADDKLSLRSMVNSSLRQLASIGCIGAILIWGWADELNRLMYPSDFAESATILRVAGLSFVPLLIQWVYVNLLWVRNRWWTIALCYGSVVGLQIAAEWVLVPQFGGLAAAWVIVGADLLLAICLGLATHRQIHNSTATGVLTAALTLAAAVCVVLLGDQLELRQLASPAAIAVFVGVGLLTGAIREVDVAHFRLVVAHLTRVRKPG